MGETLDLKEIERKAFRSTFQDGLWDMYLGLIIICMSIYLHRPTDGYTPMNIVVMVLLFVVAYSLFFTGKKYLTLPRMGQVRFGDIRKRKNRTLFLILGIFILLQVGLVWLTALGRVNFDLAMVAVVGSLIVGTSMIVVVHFLDFTRGYYIAILMALAVFLMIFLDQPIYPLLIGGGIIVPGIILFIRFLKKYPLERKETLDG